MFKRKTHIILATAFVGFSLFSNANTGHALENTEKSPHYFFIQYNGTQQELLINDSTKLTLTGWENETKTVVDGILTNSANESKNVDLIVDEGINSLTISKNASTNYRLTESQNFHAEKVNPQKTSKQTTLLNKNDNGTFIEETKTVDVHGTVIREDIQYYKTDENNQKIVITKDEYDTLNTNEVTIEQNHDSETSYKIEKDSDPEANQTASILSVQKTPSISYSTHVQSYGWMDPVKDGKMSGTAGQSKRLEAIKIKLENSPYEGGIEYSTHIQTYGWQNKVPNGKIAGTSGQAKRLEAIRINLTGEIAKHYDIYYRVHAQSYGWLDWAKNGESAGTAGLSKRLEAIEIKLVKKGAGAPGSTKKPYVIAEPSVSYTTHVQSHGWMKSVSDGSMSGTSGKAKRLEAIKIQLKDTPYKGGIEYSTHVQSYGWQDKVSNGLMSGTSGESKRLEAIKINLTGEMANHFDVYYRVHAQSYGWLGWAKNGMEAGTEGYAKRLEAIEIKLAPKGQGTEITDKLAAFINKPAEKPIEQPAGGTIYNHYNITLNEALNMQMQAAPQTDKYRNAPAYIHRDYVEIYHNGSNLVGKVTGDPLNIRADKNTNSHIYGQLLKGSEVTTIEQDGEWLRIGLGSWRNATASDVLHYLDPTNFINDEKQKFQFLNLAKPTGVTVDTLNKFLKGKGTLEGQGQAFIDAGKKYGMNEIYLLSHALLETGHGKSPLASGIEHNGKTVYNMYGYGALDACPNECGAAKAYELGWFTPYDAIVGGAKFINGGYLDGNNYIGVVQNTLYEMRWNPEVMDTRNGAAHQYATDIGWAYKQVNSMYNLYKLQPFPLFLEIPVYKG